MKATGIVRRIDDLGRIVIPKEIRRTLRIREGDSLEIYTNNTGEIVLKKFSPIGDINTIAREFAETASSLLGSTIAISDTDSFIAASGREKKHYLSKSIDPEIDEIIQAKDKYIGPEKLVIPIVSQGDAVGSVTVIPDKNGFLGETEISIAQLGANLLAKNVN